MGSSTFLTVGYFKYHCCNGGRLPVTGALREFVRRLNPKECHMYLDGQKYIFCYCFFFHTIAATVENILFWTLRKRQLVGTIPLLYRLYTTARR